MQFPLLLIIAVGEQDGRSLQPPSPSGIRGASHGTAGSMNGQFSGFSSLQAEGSAASRSGPALPVGSGQFAGSSQPEGGASTSSSSSSQSSPSQSSPPPSGPGRP